MKSGPRPPLLLSPLSPVSVGLIISPLAQPVTDVLQVIASLCSYQGYLGNIRPALVPLLPPRSSRVPSSRMNVWF